MFLKLNGLKKVQFLVTSMVRCMADVPLDIMFWHQKSFWRVEALLDEFHKKREASEQWIQLFSFFLKKIYSKITKNAENGK